MQLRCKVCAAVQPVTVADEADEDPRTLSIRRFFRAEHVASCGEGSVSLQLGSAEALYIDPEVWPRYLESLNPPSDVQLGSDGFFSRAITRDGVTHNVRVCEDCWQNIPRYVDFQDGLISPESDGAVGTVPKLRPSTVETDSPERAQAAVHLPKAVCLPCYLAAFRRVYPDVELPALSGAVIGDGAPVTPAASEPPEAQGRVMVARIGRDEVLA